MNRQVQIAVAAAGLALALAMFFRFEVLVSPAHGDIEATVYRIDRWTGSVELLGFGRRTTLGERQDSNGRK